MKKLSLIVALAVILTIGGVFAAWSYPGGSVANEATTSVTIAVADGGQAGAKGDITVSSNTMNITIDQGTGYAATLVKTGKATVLYTKKTDAGAEHNTINLIATITVGGNNTYNEAAVLTAVNVNLGSFTTGTAQTIGFEGADIDLSSAINIASIVLDNYDKYTAFKDSVSPTISIVISEGTLS